MFEQMVLLNSVLLNVLLLSTLLDWVGIFIMKTSF